MAGMLKVSRLTDYATAILLTLLRHDRVCSAEEVASQLGLEVPTCAKVLKLLTRAGLLVSTRGARGGYQLARTPEAISVYDVLHAIEGGTALTECAREDSRCEWQTDCGQRSAWQHINASIRDTLLNISLASLQQLAQLPLPGVDKSRPDLPLVIK